MHSFRSIYTALIKTFSVSRIVILNHKTGYKVKRLPSENWPHEGNITFHDVSLTYYPGGPQVLKKINLTIKGGEKIGIAGRTGAGSLHFVASLLRMPEADGGITVRNTTLNINSRPKSCSF